MVSENTRLSTSDTARLSVISLIDGTCPTVLASPSRSGRSARSPFQRLVDDVAHTDVLGIHGWQRRGEADEPIQLVACLFQLGDPPIDSLPLGLEDVDNVTTGSFGTVSKSQDVPRMKASRATSPAS